jgi:hypothetical protein
MAITIFTIAPMSAGPERVFSGARHTISLERMALGAKMVEISECLKSWVKIREGREQAVLAGVFRHNREIEHLTKILKEAVGYEG